MTSTARNAAYVGLPNGVVLPYYADVSQSFYKIDQLSGVLTSTFYQVPSGQIEIPISIQFLFTTSAVVGTRLLELLIGSAVFPNVDIFAAAGQAASHVWNYLFLQHATAWSAVTGLGTFPSVDGSLAMPLPPIALDPGQRLSIFNQGFNDVGDAIGATMTYSRYVIPTVGEDYSSVLPQSFDPSLLQ